MSYKRYTQTHFGVEQAGHVIHIEREADAAAAADTLRTELDYAERVQHYQSLMLRLLPAAVVMLMLALVYVRDSALSGGLLVLCAGGFALVAHVYARSRTSTWRAWWSDLSYASLPIDALRARLEMGLRANARIERAAALSLGVIALYAGWSVIHAHYLGLTSNPYYAVGVGSAGAGAPGWVFGLGLYSSLVAWLPPVALFRAWKISGGFASRLDSTIRSAWDANSEHPSLDVHSRAALAVVRIRRAQQDAGETSGGTSVRSA